MLLAYSSFVAVDKSIEYVDAGVVGRRCAKLGEVEGRAGGWFTTRDTRATRLTFTPFRPPLTTVAAVVVVHNGGNVQLLPLNHRMNGNTSPRRQQRSFPTPVLRHLPW